MLQLGKYLREGIPTPFESRVNLTAAHPPWVRLADKIIDNPHKKLLGTAIRSGLMAKISDISIMLFPWGAKNPAVGHYQLEISCKFVRRHFNWGSFLDFQ